MASSHLHLSTRIPPPQAILFRSDKICDFHFTSPDENDLPIHRITLAVKSPVFKHYFASTTAGDSSDIISILSFTKIIPYFDSDTAFQALLRKALWEIITFCYLNEYIYDNSTKDFEGRVRSRLLTHALAVRFELPRLVGLVETHFRDSFAWFCKDATCGEIEDVLRICYWDGLRARVFVEGRTLELLNVSAGWMKELLVERYEGVEEVMERNAGVGRKENAGDDGGIDGRN